MDADGFAGEGSERVGQGALSKEVTCGQRPEWSERMSHVGMWGRTGTGNGNSQCKGPEVGMCLVCSWNIKEAAWLCSAGKGGGVTGIQVMRASSSS